jgi:hypothetical protein
LRFTVGLNQTPRIKLGRSFRLCRRIIGGDLRYKVDLYELFVDRASYFDTKGAENNTQLGRSCTDPELREFIGNIYGVLLTRGIRRTYVYAVDPEMSFFIIRFFRMTRVNCDVYEILEARPFVKYSEAIR